MPAVTAVPPSSATPAAAGAPAIGPGAAAAPGFAAVLQRQALVGRTVTLGQMVSALIGTADASPAARVGPGAGVGGALDAGTGEQAVLSATQRYLGVPYLWGGTDPTKGLDCSGFVQRVYADLGVALPRVSVDQSKAGVGVPNLEQARPGDLVYWSGSPNHIGIYAGEGTMIVAPKTGDVVKYQTITRTPHAIRRIL